MKNSLFIFLASLVLIVPSARAVTELAKVNNKVITLEDFEKKYKDNLKYFIFKSPSKKAVLEDMIRRELAVQEAKKMNLDQDPEIQERINFVLYQAVLEKKLGKEIESITVPDDEAKSFYAKNPEIRTSKLFAACSAKISTDEDKKCLERIKIMQSKLNEGKMSFAEVAQKFSEGETASMGGDTDYINRFNNAGDPEYYEAAIKVGQGKTSSIVRTPRGYHIIKVTAIRTWDDVDRGMIKRMVFETHRAELFEKYLNTLKAQAKVSSKPELLKE